METSRSFLLRNARSPHITMFASVVVFGSIIIAFLFGYAAFGDNSNDSFTLKQVNIIFRHGDKNPTSTYANDPYKEPIFWPDGWGQLTVKGKKQIFHLGQTLHTRYERFLPVYSSQTVRVDSSDLDRCHQSAAVLLAAWFPPQSGQIWNDQLLWQPIPIHSTPRDLDKLITVGAKCPLYEVEKQRSDAELASKHDIENEELYQYLSKETGQNVSSLMDVETIFNVLEIERSNGKILPSWTDSIFPGKMKDIAALVLASFTYTPVMKRLRGGPLIGAIRTNMNGFISGQSSKKLSLYSAHDLTIVNVRRALGFEELTFKPELGSALIVELHVVNNVPEVELYYLESFEASAPVKWELPSCPSPCGLATFSESVSSVIPQDWDAECQSK